MSTLYQVKAHPVASQFLGLALHHDTVARTIALSYPGYVDALLLRLRPLGVQSALTPAVYVYVPPTYGSRLPQSPNTADASPPASPAQRLELQIAIGYLLGAAWMAGFSRPLVPSPASSPKLPPSPCSPLTASWATSPCTGPA